MNVTGWAGGSGRACNHPLPNNNAIITTRPNPFILNPFIIRVICGSVWKLLAGLNDPDVVIRELKVRGLDLDLRHVTRSAILVSHRTALAVAGFRALVAQ